MSNDTTIYIDGRRWRYWTRMTWIRSIDSIDTVEFQSPFDSTEPLFRETFKPLSYKQLDIAVNDEPIFTGVMPVVIPDDSADSNVVTVAGYSSPGVLGECTIPESVLPVDFRGQNLHEIAKSLADPFDLTLDVRAQAGAVFKKIKLKPTQKILSFLIDLAKQRGQLIASNVYGDLVFWEAVDLSFSKPVALFRQGEPSITKITPEFRPQQYFSEITGLKPVRVRSKKLSRYTERNTLLPDVFRPYMFEAKDVKTGELPDAVRGAVGRMLGNAVAYTLETPSWRDQNGDLWAPNTMVKVVYPNVMIYNEFTFLIRRVELRQSSDKETAVLSLVMPGSFSGAVEGGYPWDE